MLFKDKCSELGDWGQRVLREYNEEINKSRGLSLDTLTHGSVQKASFTCEVCGHT